MPLRNIEELTWVTKLDGLITSDKTGAWCRLPYPDHPNGCPQYGEQDTCPPQAPYIWDVMEPPFYLVTSEFDLSAHVADYHIKFPDWTDRQCRNVLYWQGGNKKVLRLRAERAMRLGGLSACTYRPEAMGVNVYATAAIAGIKLDRIRDIHICTHVAIIGNKRRPQ
ncbi:hypothetical protein LCGC14_1348180 [marine sediment metagenome]|uniref:Uncharacterized protein n=1 Tax=marine sediment metagenome TaxID=412755 RepID=A0A0F9MSH2_9ZZZZ